MATAQTRTDRVKLRAAILGMQQRVQQQVNDAIRRESFCRARAGKRGEDGQPDVVLGEVGEVERPVPACAALVARVAVERGQRAERQGRLVVIHILRAGQHHRGDASEGPRCFHAHPAGSCITLAMRPQPRVHHTAWRSTRADCNISIGPARGQHDPPPHRILGGCCTIDGYVHDALLAPRDDGDDRS